jgi:hypothetical protein
MSSPAIPRLPETPCLVTYADGSKVISSFESVAKYRALYGEPSFTVSAIPKAEGAK